jgi:site-specific DNA-cytosine methylase
LKALGNAVVPQVVEALGRAIMEIERRERQWT